MRVDCFHARTYVIDSLTVELAGPPLIETSLPNVTHRAEFRWHAEENGQRRFGASGSWFFIYHGRDPVAFAKADLLARLQEDNA